MVSSQRRFTERRLRTPSKRRTSAHLPLQRVRFHQGQRQIVESKVSEEKGERKSSQHLKNDHRIPIPSLAVDHPLGSPPSQFWSLANTVGDKGEESAALARALVSILRLFYEVLQAVFMVRYMSISHRYQCPITYIMISTMSLAA